MNRMRPVHLTIGALAALAPAVRPPQAPATRPAISWSFIFNSADSATSWQGRQGGTLIFTKTADGAGALRFEGPAGAVMHGPDFTNLPAILQSDTIRIRARSTAAPAPKTPPVLEVHFSCAGRPATFWRKMSFPSGEWIDFEFPLSMFRESSSGLPEWRLVDHLYFYSRGPASFEFRSLQIEARAPRVSPDLTIGEIRDLAFPGDAGKAVITSESRPFVILTNEPRLDAPAVHLRLAELLKLVRADFPDFTPPAQPVPLIIFKTQDEYKDFWERFMMAIGATGGAPQSDGFTSHRIATSFYKEQLRDRPVFVHEAAHALLEHYLQTNNAGEWLHEGLAARYQTMVFGQDVRKVVQEGIARESYRNHFSELFNGKKIQLNRYWQSMSWIEFLLSDPARREKFTKLRAAFSKAGSTDIAGSARAIFNKTVDELETEWLAWAGEHYK